MTLRIIGAGVGRTGTHSLKLALERLLGGRCYHMLEILERPDDIPKWIAATKGDLPDWPGMFDGYVATVDEPSTAFWRDLMLAYPQAYVLLSYRDADDWWQSASRTIMRAHREQPAGPFRDLLDALTDHAPFARDERDAKAAYEAHNAAVREGVPPDRLIVWQPGDGWDPICSALELPVPDEPFPHVNTTREFVERLERRLSG
jgi:hypothetical protein